MKLIKKIKNFILSFFAHAGRGFPKADQFTINSRYLQCISCSSYDAENKECSECGCNINKKQEFLNKLAWQDQKCPLGKW